MIQSEIVEHDLCVGVLHNSCIPTEIFTTYTRQTT